MKRGICFLVASILTMLMACSPALAGGWTVPNNHSSASGSSPQTSGVTAKLIEDLATRSGPSTSYTGCGSYRMKGQKVTVLSRAYDNNGVLWVEIEFTYGGGYRRAWTGAKRLNLSTSQLRQLDEMDSTIYIGYGTVNTRVAPRFGPDNLYASYGDRDYSRGNRVAVIAEENNYYMVESYFTDGNILRSWIPCDSVNLD